MSKKEVMELPKQFDNITQRVIDDLKTTLQKGSKVSMAAASFSIYAFEALQKELEKIDELRFIFTSPTFNKEHSKKQKREFYIPKLNCERMRKEPQLDRPILINKQVKSKRKELEELKNKLEKLK